MDAVPTAEEVDFVLEILDRIAAPALDKIELLLESAGHWDSVTRNDFCRFVHLSLYVAGGTKYH